MADDFNDDSSGLTVDDIKFKLRALWYGQVPLFETFWIYYFIGVFVLGLLGTVLGDVFSILALLWAGFMVKPIMAAADKYEGEKTWALLAKVAAVIIAISVLLEVIF